jgi:tRNA G18 (ribose-2'-O)-methylase SpoU
VKLERIASPDDPRIADYRGVRDPEWLRRRGLFLAEGRSAVQTLLDSSRFRTRSLLLTATAYESLRDALDRLDGPTPVYLVERDVLARVSGVRFHQGCVAAGEVGEAPSAADVLAALGPGPRLLVVLQDVTNPDNVGGVFRSAHAFDVDAVLLTPRCCSPLYRKAIRTSLGAALRIPFAELDPGAPGLSELRKAGFAPLALTPRADALELSGIGTTRLPPERPALIIGSEHPGLPPELLDAADLQLRIPMSPTADSLNLATATAIALEHFFRLRTRKATQAAP